MHLHAEPLYINVGSLIEYVTSGSAAGDMVVISISDDHKVTATITDGSITLAKLTTEIQTAIGKAHSHDNKDVLDGINADKVAAWDAAEQNAKDYADGKDEAIAAAQDTADAAAAAAVAGYCRISVDDELDRDNVSIENQKSIIEDFVKQRFPSSTLTFYEDRDRSGYTFEQREGYQTMRRELMRHKYDILIVKDFSRFSRRNSRGLVELEDLRDAGVRIISIGDGIDFPNDDDWLKIQFQFLINEMPVTDTSKKVRNVIIVTLFHY